MSSISDEDEPSPPSRAKPPHPERGPEGEEEVPLKLIAQTKTNMDPPQDSNFKILRQSSSSASEWSEGSLPGPKEVDILLAQELNRMSAPDRERAFQDLHCVSSYIPGESPKSIAEALQEVQLIITKMDPSTRAACDIAQRQDPRLLKEPKFVLRFLRAAMYEPDDCAKRLVSYFEVKRHLFGTKKLCKRVTLDDLDEDDIRCLDSGIMQILPARDRAGRAIFFWNMCLRGSHSRQSKQRVQFYGLQAGSESEVVQQRGMVIVSWNHGPGKMPAEEMEVAFRNPAMVAMHDVRCEAFHFCCDGEDGRIISSAIMTLVGEHTRVRFRTHTGSVPEIRKSLSSFGIPVLCLPFTETGSYLFHSSSAWLKEQREMEASVVSKMEGASALTSLLTTSIKRKPAEEPVQTMAGQANFDNVVEPDDSRKKAKIQNQGLPLMPTLKEAPQTVAAKPAATAKKASKNPTKREPKEGEYVPTEKDVVLGKGRYIQDMPGNVRFRSIIKLKFNRYESCASNQDKTFLAMEVVADIKESGGKFLREDKTAPGGYAEVDALVARDKAASTFHSHRRFHKKNMETAAAAASTAISALNHENKGHGDRSPSSNNATGGQFPRAMLGIDASRPQLLLRSNPLAPANRFGVGSLGFGSSDPSATSSAAHVFSRSHMLSQFGFPSVLPQAAIDAATMSRSGAFNFSRGDSSAGMIPLGTMEDRAHRVQQMGLNSSGTSPANSSEALVQAKAQIYAERAELYRRLGLPASGATLAAHGSLGSGAFADPVPSSGRIGMAGASQVGDNNQHPAATSQDVLHARIYREMGLPRYEC